MFGMQGVFLMPQPRTPGLWTSTCSDRFMPKDAPETSLAPGPVSIVAAEASSRNDELLGSPDFLTFFFQPVKDTSIAGPCAKRSFQAHPGVVLLPGKKEVRFNEIPLNFPKSRLLFLELTCVGKTLGAHCATERLANGPIRARFLNSASFGAVVAFAKPSSSPYAALGELRQTTVLVSVHNLTDQTPMARYQVEIWEIPSTHWIGIPNIPPGVASALGKMQAVPGAPPVPGFPPMMGVRPPMVPPVVPGMVPPPIPGQPVNFIQQQAMEYEESKARDTVSIRWMERGVFRGTLTPNPAVEKVEVEAVVVTTVVQTMPTGPTLAIGETEATEVIEATEVTEVTEVTEGVDLEVIKLMAVGMAAAWLADGNMLERRKFVLKKTSNNDATSGKMWKVKMSSFKDKQTVTLVDSGSRSRRRGRDDRAEDYAGEGN
eukprot:Skav210259  [mRNA]  locus=scaffold1929:253171:265770:- [translate_table: standard]